MLTRVITGGFAKYKLGKNSVIAKFIGSELQRFSSAGVQTGLAISGMTSHSRLSAGQIAGNKFRTAALAGVKGSATYTNRRLLSSGKGGSSYIKSTIGIRRNLQILQRPTSSVTGGGFRLTSIGKFRL